MRYKLTISLPEELATYLKKEAKKSGYSTTSKYIQRLLLLTHREKLFREIKKKRDTFDAFVQAFKSLEDLENAEKLG